MAKRAITIGLESPTTTKELIELLAAGEFTPETLMYIKSIDGQERIKKLINKADKKKDIAIARIYRKYLKTLAQPIQFGQRQDSAILLSGVVPLDWEEKNKEEIKKLDLLCEHYGIAEGQSKHLNLSLALARELYPEGNRQRRPKKWTDEIKAILAAQMEVIMAQENKNISWAANKLTKQEPWNTFIEKIEDRKASSDPVEVLRTQYSRSHRIPAVKAIKVSLLKKTREELNSYANLFVRKPRRN